MAVDIDGSVGVVRPGSWWRSGMPTPPNHSRDQRKVSELLASIPTSQGGRKGMWSRPEPPGPDRSCSPAIANAILAFQQHWQRLGAFKNIDGVVDPRGNTLRKLNELAVGGVVPPPPPPGPAPKPSPPGPPATFTVRDVRLFGWKPPGDVLEVNGTTPLRWVIDNVVTRGKANGGNLVLKIMAHGLPGFVQCAAGNFPHPTLGDVYYEPTFGKKVFIGPGKPGISVADLNAFRQLAGLIKRIEFHSCLVARIGRCEEANGHTCYDGNEFCYMLAQATRAEIVASIHLQYYWLGGPKYGPFGGAVDGMDFGHWNGQVFTWGPAGNIIETKNYPYRDLNGPAPPGTNAS